MARFQCIPLYHYTSYKLAQFNFVYTFWTISQLMGSISPLFQAIFIPNYTFTIMLTCWFIQSEYGFITIFLWSFGFILILLSYYTSQKILDHDLLLENQHISWLCAPFQYLQIFNGYHGRSLIVQEMIWTHKSCWVSGHRFLTKHRRIPYSPSHLIMEIM